MYPVNVYSVTPEVTLQTHCTCGPTRRAHTESSSENLAAAPRHKAATPPWPIKAYLYKKLWDLIDPQRT